MSGGEGGSVDDRTVPEVIEGLRALLRVIDAGEVAASDVQRAHLAGAVDTLEALSEAGATAFEHSRLR